MDQQLLLKTALPPRFDHLPRIKRWLMTVFAKVHYGTLLIHIDGVCYACGQDESVIADLHIIKPFSMARRGMAGGDLGFAESYIEGDWHTNNLCALLTLLLKNRTELGKTYGGKRLVRASTNLLHKLRKNSLKGSRKNIRAHYDLGNDFYQCWLDESMTYSAALFLPENKQQSASQINADKSLEHQGNQPSGSVFSYLDHEKSAKRWGGANSGQLAGDFTQSLAQAQATKYQRILDQLQVQPTDNILEVGCGWGGFAEKALAQGCKLHGITLSQEQLAYAKTRLQNYGEKARLELRDYREIDGQYDHIVSIEMFEAVGEAYWQTYFEMLKRSLKANGSIMLQIIIIQDAHFDLYKRRADFIQRYIFPGGMLPSESKLQALIETNQLQTVNRIGFGHHYGETLARWEQNVNKAKPQLKQLGYDERFLRMWQYYLCYCQAGFAEERIDVVQLQLKHAT